ACPSVDQCTALDDRNGVVTFDPASPGTPARHVINDSTSTVLYDLTCLSTDECVAVGYAGVEVTFDPASPGAAARTTIGTETLGSVACVSPTKCVAVESNAVVTFNPRSPSTRAR